jgi:hypothetical protein
MAGGERGLIRRNDDPASLEPRARLAGPKAARPGPCPCCGAARNRLGGTKCRCKGATCGACGQCQTHCRCPAPGPS